MQSHYSRLALILLTLSSAVTSARAEEGKPLPSPPRPTIGLYTSRILFRDIELRLESSSMKSVYAGVTMRSTEEKP